MLTMKQSTSLAALQTEYAFGWLGGAVAVVLWSAVGWLAALAWVALWLVLTWPDEWATGALSDVEPDECSDE